jgi:tetraacyldisaccharide 4'-kinase
MKSMDNITVLLESAIAENRLPVTLAAVSGPLSAFYGAGTAFRNALYDRFPALSHAALRPVISIGGIRAGGTGKTPVAAMIGAYLASKEIGVAYLSRGYRREDSACRIVAPGESVPWRAIGDEPALLHSRLPQSWLGIGPDRSKAAARLAPLLPPRSVFVLDDGFQHRALRRDLDIVCLHESFSTDRLIPAGFLREPLSSLSRAGIALIIGPPEHAEALMHRKSLLAARFPGLFVAVMYQEPGCWVNARDGRRSTVPPPKNPVLVCGIARPGRFTDMVRKAGIVPSATLIFGDHHPYEPDNFRNYREVLPNGIITTEKDAVRLQSMDVVQLEKMWYLTIEMRFADSADEIECNSLIDRVIR